MAVPRNRTSNAKKNSRRSHMAKKKKVLSICSNCKKPTLAHKMCPFCGYYGGKSIIHEKTEK
jgi:large subunit ribosomal protein L32